MDVLYFQIPRLSRTGIDQSQHLYFIRNVGFLEFPIFFVDSLYYFSVLQ